MRAKMNTKHCDEKCKFNINNVCCFGPRKQYGCYLDIGEGGIDKIYQKEIGYTLMRAAQFENIRNAPEKIDEIRQNFDAIEKLRSKPFGFIYKEHNYTVNDAARDQGECPHCGEKASDGFFWNKERDKNSYIGTYSFGGEYVAVCFECPGCFEKFFYHNTE